MLMRVGILVAATTKRHLRNRGDSRQDGPRDAGRQKVWRFLCPRSHCADRGRAGDEARNGPCKRQSELCPEQAYRNIACRTDGHDQHDHDPDRMRIERQVGAYLAVRYQRQNDKCRRSKDQRVVQFVLRDDTGDKVVQPGLRVEKHRHCHSDCGGSLGRFHAHATQ